MHYLEIYVYTKQILPVVLIADCWFCSISDASTCKKHNLSKDYFQCLAHIAEDMHLNYVKEMTK